VRDLTAPPTPGYFDQAVSTWVPVGRRAVSPDGLHYATTTEGVVDKLSGTVQTPATLHVVAASSGSERVIPLTGLRPQPAATALSLEIVGFESDAVYGVESGQAGAGELYRIDLSTGSVIDLRGATRPEAVESGGFWFGGLDPNANLGAPPSDLERWDLTTGKTTLWFRQPAADVRFLGLDRTGSALVNVITTNPDGSPQSIEIWLVSAPGKQTQINASASADLGSGEAIGMIADEHGLWFGSQKGIFLYIAGAGLWKVSNFEGFPANGCS